MQRQRKLNDEVKECITTSLLNLLQQKPFEEISIVEIIRYAGVSRNSFYRNFNSKENILSKYVDKVTWDFIENSSIPVFQVPWETYIQEILIHMYQNREVVDLLLLNGKGHLISAVFDKAIYERTKDKTDEHHIWFLSGGIFNLYKHWAENGYKESPKDVACSFHISVLHI